jgi:hypothetical protein
MTLEELRLEAGRHNHVLVPYGDIIIREAAALFGDTWYLEKMGPILHHCPGITPAAYWELTVAEHTHLALWIHRSFESQVDLIATPDQVGEEGTGGGA